MFDDMMRETNHEDACFICGKATFYVASVCDAPVCKTGCLERAWEGLKANGPKVTFVNGKKEKVLSGRFMLTDGGDIYVNDELVGCCNAETNCLFLSADGKYYENVRVENG